MSVMAPGTAHAEDSKASAEALFREGRMLIEQNRIAEACERFSQSYRLDSSAGTLLNLAICHEQQGKTATAWGEFHEVIRVSRGNRPERVRIAQEHLAKIEPVLARLTIQVPEGEHAKGFVITVDGEPRDEKAWGVPLPIDPGSHTVVTKAEGFDAVSQTVVVAAAETKATTVPAMNARATGVLISTPTERDAAAASKNATSPSPSAQQAASNGISTQRILGMSATGVGALVFASGAYFGIKAWSDARDVDSQCPQKECDQGLVDANESARRRAVVGDILMVSGAVVAGAGLWLWLSDDGKKQSASSSASSASSANVGLFVRGASIDLRGRF